MEPTAHSYSPPANQKGNQQFEALFQNASLGILVVNKTGDIVLANNFLLSQFKYDDLHELIGKKVEVLIPGRFHQHHVKDRNGYNANPERRPMGIGRDLFAIKKKGKNFLLK